MPFETICKNTPVRQFYTQLVNRPHFGTGILLFGPLGSQGSKEKKSGFEEFWATLDGSFPTFVGQNKHLNFFAKLL